MARLVSAAGGWVGAGPGVAFVPPSPAFFQAQGHPGPRGGSPPQTTTNRRPRRHGGPAWVPGATIDSTLADAGPESRASSRPGLSDRAGAGALQARPVTRGLRPRDPRYPIPAGVGAGFPDFRFGQNSSWELDSRNQAGSEDTGNLKRQAEALAQARESTKFQWHEVSPRIDRKNQSTV